MNGVTSYTLPAMASSPLSRRWAGGGERQRERFCGRTASRGGRRATGEIDRTATRHAQGRGRTRDRSTARRTVDDEPQVVRARVLLDLGHLDPLHFHGRGLILGGGLRGHRGVGARPVRARVEVARALARRSAHSHRFRAIRTYGTWFETGKRPIQSYNAQSETGRICPQLAGSGSFAGFKAPATRTRRSSSARGDERRARRDAKGRGGGRGRAKTDA